MLGEKQTNKLTKKKQNKTTQHFRGCEIFKEVMCPKMKSKTTNISNECQEHDQMAFEYLQGEGLKHLSQQNTLV